MDPITLMAGVTVAFNGLKQVVGFGKEVVGQCFYSKTDNKGWW